MRLDEITTEYKPHTNEIGVMTLSEFMKFRNPDGKMHPNDAYDVTLKSLNRDFTEKQVFNTRGFSSGFRGYDTILENPKGYIFMDGDDITAFVIDDTLYHTNKFNKNNLPLRTENFRIAPTKSKLVKYMSDYVHLIDNKLDTIKKEYPIVIKRMKLKGEYFEFRIAKSPYEKDSGATIEVLNSSGFVVGSASDEWGTTLLMIAQEMKGYGLGLELGKFWYEHNPSYGSGGFTEQGKKNAERIWADRVRQFLSNGWYSDLIQKGEISKEKVSEILADLPERKTKIKDTPKKEIKPLIVSDDVSFIIYDEAFLTDPVEENIYAHGFFRETESHGSHIYSLDYDKKFRKLAHYVALQMARNNGEKVYIGDKPSDVLELDGLEDITIDGDYVTLDKDVLPLSDFRKIEKQKRKAVDKYDELYYTLQELADSKWD